MAPNGKEYQTDEYTGLLQNRSPQQHYHDASQLSNLFVEPEKDDNSSKNDIAKESKQHSRTLMTILSSISRKQIQGTIVGSVVFLLYHIVFCLAQAATITRPHSSSNSNTGIMAQMAALGTVTAGPLFLMELSQDIPAIYPASDLFLAPFLAHLAQAIDETLYKHNLQDDDEVFLATFGAVLAVGFLMSGGLCVLAARVKLANLGAFLPYSVLCGFFTTIGILMWTLGFSVDVGKKINEVIFSGDKQVMLHAFIHHLPSLLIGIVMHFLGAQNPIYVILLVLATVFGSYAVLWVTGTTLEEAQAADWYFSPNELIVEKTTYYGPSAPFGVWVSLWKGGVIFWEAFAAGIPIMLALVFLYLVRSSLHSAALKKNIPNVTRHHKPQDHSSGTIMVASPPPVGGRQESIRKEKKKAPLTLNFILEHGYGYSQILSGLVGGITIAPSVAASLTLFQLGAETPPPQYGSCILVLYFLIGDFSVVKYIPKPAFSCLMVLAGLDMCRTWIYDSYRKTEAKSEWIIGPILVVLAFSIGVLNAIFCGIACSTFIFVANFYRAGAVKFVGSGLSLRSSVERGITEDHWLDQNGDLIQILVVQNYLFFGNSQSVLTYIATMFEEDDENSGDAFPLPPLPKYLIVDFCLVSGMDTSAVDTIREIISLCRKNKCKLFLAGLRPSLRSNLLYAGLKPPRRSLGGQRVWVYTSDMETALASAEDSLLSNVFHLEEKDESESSRRLLQRKMRAESIGENVDDGFRYALKKIDEQHGLTTARDLIEFLSSTSLVVLEPGDTLVTDAVDHGLFFVETGLIRVQRTKVNTESGTKTPAFIYQDGGSIGHLNARSQSIGRETTVWKKTKQQTQHTEQCFRLARIGQGWIIGGIEATNGMQKPGIHVAISACRLHHLPRTAIEAAERNSPHLAMNLYKALSHLATKRQEMTIDHLGQHLKILNSPVPRLRGQGKRALAKIQDQFR